MITEITPDQGLTTPALEAAPPAKEKKPRVKQTIGSAEQVLATAEVLCGYAARGISNKALASGLGIAPSAVTRIMNTLIAQGWARKDLEHELFYPSTRIIKLSAKAMQDLDSAEQRLRDARASFVSA